MGYRLSNKDQNLIKLKNSDLIFQSNKNLQKNPKLKSSRISLNDLNEKEQTKNFLRKKFFSYKRSIKNLNPNQ